MRRPFKEQAIEVTAALITDAVTLSAFIKMMQQIIGFNVTAEVAGNIANVTDITVDFPER